MESGLKIMSAIIVVHNPDNCHPHLVRLHERLWTCGAEMCSVSHTHTNRRTLTYFISSGNNYVGMYTSHTHVRHMSHYQ